MTDKIRRRRRCMLSVPGSSQRKIEKSLAMGVDFIFLDLEDAVAPDMKPQARQNIIRAFNEMDWNGAVRCFRMNGLDTPWAVDDLTTVVEAAGANIDTIMVPKVKYARDVHFVDTLLEIIERKQGLERRIGLELLIEEVEGIQNIADISLATDRVESLMFGIGDYTRAQGVDPRDAFGPPRVYPGDIWHHQRSTLAVAAKVAAVDYVDGPWALIQDLDGYRRECEMVQSLGGVGKWAIHPSQVPVATQVFSPGEEEIQFAVQNLAEFEAARAQGLGAVRSSTGALLDEAVIPLLEQVLATARFYDMPIPEAQAVVTEA